MTGGSVKRRKLTSTRHKVITARSTADCAICLSELCRPATLNPCLHLFCLTCIERWTQQAESCPLCKSTISFFTSDATRHYPLLARARRRRQAEKERRFRRRGRWQVPVIQSQSLERRRNIYRRKSKSLYIGSNAQSQFRAINLTDLQGNAEPQRKMRAKAALFVRRELQIFDYLEQNREYLLKYIVDGILTRFDIHSESAHKLVADFLGADTDIFLHELRTFLRSPYKTLQDYDDAGLIQYG